MSRSLYGYERVNVFQEEIDPSLMYIENGILKSPLFNEDNIEAYTEILRKDVMNSEVPHWKTVAVAVSDGETRTAIHTIKGTYTSYIKLGIAANSLILANPIEELSALEEETFGLDKQNFRKIKLVSAVDKDDVNTGISSNTKLVYPTVKRSIKNSAGEVIGTNATMENIEVETLVKDTKITEISAATEISFILLRSTGMLDFDKTSEFIKNSSGLIKYYPTRAIYDLNDVISIKRYDPSFKEGIRITYKKNINENVLKEILVGWFNDRIVSDY